MFYLFRAQADPKLKKDEKKLPKYGKIVLLLFFLFHVAFLGFNFWYFYYKADPNADNQIDVGSFASPAVEDMEWDANPPIKLQWNQIKKASLVLSSLSSVLWYGSEFASWMK